jgi:hypothetical protein
MVVVTTHRERLQRAGIIPGSGGKRVVPGEALIKKE